MDQGVISIAKLNFKRLMLSDAIQKTRASNVTFMDYLKKVNILDAITLFDEAWKGVPESAMIGVWNKLLLREKPSTEPEIEIHPGVDDIVQMGKTLGKQ